MPNQSWEKRFSKYYGAMFECGDFEQLMKDISHLLKERDEEHKLLMARSNEWWNQKLKEEKEQYKSMIKWSCGDDTGSSSMAIMRFMNGIPQSVSGFYYNAPADKDDRGRCIRLLNRFPEWWKRIDLMKSLSDEWREQIELMKEEKDN